MWEKKKKSIIIQIHNTSSKDPVFNTSSKQNKTKQNSNFLMDQKTAAEHVCYVQLTEELEV